MSNKLTGTIKRARRPVLQCHLTSGVRIAGFSDPQCGTFEAVTTIQTPLDIDRFMDAYGIGVLTTEYVS